MGLCCSLLYSHHRRLAGRSVCNWFNGQALGAFIGFDWQAIVSAMGFRLRRDCEVMTVDCQVELSADARMLQPSVQSSASTVRQKCLQQVLCATFGAAVSLDWQADMSANGSMLRHFCGIMSVDYQAEWSANDSILQPSVRSSASTVRQRCMKQLLCATFRAAVSLDRQV